MPCRAAGFAAAITSAGRFYGKARCQQHSPAGTVADSCRPCQHLPDARSGGSLSMSSSWDGSSQQPREGHVVPNRCSPEQALGGGARICLPLQAGRCWDASHLGHHRLQGGMVRVCLRCMRGQAPGKACRPGAGACLQQREQAAVTAGCCGL